jgi:Mg-chelatase subunit ChlD
MPFVTSVFFHVGLALVLLFIGVIVTPELEPPPREVAVFNPVIPPDPPRTIDSTPVDEDSADLDRPSQRRRDVRRREAPGDAGRTVQPIQYIAPRSPLPDVAASPGGGGDGFFDGGERNGGSPADVVFVMDRSGSMIEGGRLGSVIRELVRYVSRMNTKYRFHAIFFAAGTPLEKPDGLVRATPARKRQLARFLRTMRAQGQTDPIPALRRAFAELESAPHRADRPRVIYLLTDGVFADPDAVLAAIRKENAGRRVRIYTFLYGNRPTEAVSIMKRIAKENDGQYKYVSPDE